MLGFFNFFYSQFCFHFIERLEMKVSFIFSEATAHQQPQTQPGVSGNKVTCPTVSSGVKLGQCGGQEWASCGGAGLQAREARETSEKQCPLELAVRGLGLLSSGPFHMGIFAFLF
jgi:hypothetical protein